MRLQLVVLFALAALLPACAPTAQSPQPTPADQVPEVSYSQARLLLEWGREGDRFVSPPLDVPEGGATRVAMLLHKRADAPSRDLDVQVHAGGEAIDAEHLWSEGRREVLGVTLPRATTEIRVSVAAGDAPGIERVLISTLVPPPRVDVARPGGLVVEAPSVAELPLTFDGVIPRADWGARATECSTSDPDKDTVTVHHTVTPPEEDGDYDAAVRSVQRYHMDGRNYCDVGYHFLVTQNGSIYEGRPVELQGAHVAYHNPHNIGVSFVGCYEPGAPDCQGADMQPTSPPDIMVDNASSFIKVLVDYYGITVDSAHVLGHRDHDTASTACPGETVYAYLNEFRAIAAGLDGGWVDTSPAEIKGVVWDRSITEDVAESTALGARLGGATVLLAQNGFFAAETTTAEDGYWSFQVEPGTYTVWASLNGYASASNEVTVAASETRWASVGLLPAAGSHRLTVHVVDRDTEAPIAGANIALSTGALRHSNDDGEAVFQVSPGQYLIAIDADNYPLYERTVSIIDSDFTVEARLGVDGNEYVDAGAQPAVDAGVGADAGGFEPPFDGGPRVGAIDAGSGDEDAGAPPGPFEIFAGCACDASGGRPGADLGLVAFGLLVALSRRRRSGARRSDDRAS